MSVTLPTIFSYQKASPFCSQYAAVYNAMTNKPNETHAGYQNTLVKGLVDGGYWTNRMDLFYVFANHSNTNNEAYLNWVNPTGSFNCTAPVAAPTWTQYVGIQGNASSQYLNTGYTPSSSATNMTQDSATLGIYVLDDTSSTTMYPVGCSHDEPSLHRFAINPEYGGNAPRYFINTGTQIAGTLTTASNGLHLASRTASDAVEAYFRGSSVGSNTAASVGRPAQALLICCTSSVGTPASFDSRRIALVMVCNGISSADASAINTIIEAYMTNLGIGV